MRKIILILLFFISFGLTVTGHTQEGAVNMKKAVMIIPESDFRDEELKEPKDILERNNIEVKIASTTLNEVTGMLGAQVTPDIIITDIKIQDFDAIIFVGGGGSSQYWDDPLAHKLAQDAVSANKIVAAICIAPVTLARAGVLKGKRATVFSSEAKELKSEGANYTGRAVERDGNIITASGPTAARKFAEELVNALK
ncbi:MAG: DJ-1/PfpI family protein [Candidatus Omnitrophota bacterium]